jgi:hypothetical protein
MRLFRNKRDIIIVTGCNAVGKTTASNYLRELAALRNVPREDKIVADSQCLFEAMQADDKAGGLHHTHDWCEPGTQGHIHDSDKPVFPFTVTDNELPHRMRERFFKKLTKLRRTGKLWFVEWAGGVNTNLVEDPASCIDYSFATVKSMLEKGKLSQRWLKRVKAVIHVRAENEVRCVLNKQRSIPFYAQPHEIENGTAFWQKDERVLCFYGRDDFLEIEGLFRKATIPIYTIENYGSRYFYEQLGTVENGLFSSEKVAIVKSSVLSTGMVALLMHGVSVISLREPNSIKKAEKLPASTEATHLEEQ